MKRHVWLLLVSLILLSACQPKPIPVTIFVDDQVYTLTISSRLPADILTEAGITLDPADRLLYLGSPVPLDAPLPDAGTFDLTVRRAVTLVVTTPDDDPYPIQTSAQTIGQALTEAGLDLYSADLLDPPADTPITGDMSVSWQPASELTITVDGTEEQVRSAAPTVGQALAEAGLPLIGLDYSLPSENEPLPTDGQVRVVRVVESVALTQKSIPFGSRSELTADLEIDQQALIQGGEPGLAIARLRTRTEDGEQVSQVSETESIVRPPQDQVLGFGTKIVIRTAVVEGVTIEYWRALTVYATYYVPCDQNNVCHYGTSSGKRVQRGMVAMVYPWYLLFGGEPLYVPTYGFATVEDTNGANTTPYWGTYWIDVAYAQTDIVDWINKYLTIYFLTPVPANVADTYILP